MKGPLRIVDRKPTAVSFSGGKDSLLTLHELSNANDVTVLLTTYLENEGVVGIHYLRVELLEKQAEALGLQLKKVPLQSKASNHDYESAVKRALVCLRDEGIRCVAFGDLFLEDIRRYREENLKVDGIEFLFPLWRKDTKALSQQFIRDGFEAITVSVDREYLGPEWAGRRYDDSFLAELPEGIDPCGENGEFHTFVYDCPPFKHAVAFTEGPREIRDGFACLDLIPA